MTDVVKFIIPGRYWTSTSRTRSYTRLKGRSKNFNEDLRLWCKKHHGTIVWSHEYKTSPVGVLAPNGSGVEYVDVKLFYDTWIVYFKNKEEAMLFKLTWL